METLKTPSEFGLLALNALDDKYNDLINTPNAFEDFESVLILNSLIREYQLRGIEVPTNRPAPKAVSKKKWWKFW